LNQDFTGADAKSAARSVPQELEASVKGLPILSRERWAAAHFI
jgi:hypothetical protein